MEEQKQQNHQQPRVLILGKNPWAGLAASELASQGVKVIGHETDKSGEAPAQLAGCIGQDGDFTVRILQEGIIRNETVSRILVIGDAFNQSTAEAWRLLNDDFAGSIEAVLQNPQSRQGKTVVFLTGLKDLSHQSVTLDILNAALLLKKEANAKVFILCGQMQVAAPGLERLLFDARTAGVVIYKLNSADALEISLQQNGRPRLLFTDPASREYMELVPDFLVLPQIPAPDPSLAGIASLLGLETDEKGYLQSANVHRLPCGTNRPGVFVTGPARDAATPSQHKARSILGAALALIAKAEFAPKNRQATINTRACIHCLTCFRICPHKAVRQEEGKLTVLTDACQACGICAAECPRIAISMEGGWLVKDDAASRQAQAAEGFNPKIFVFTCENSSTIAAKSQQDFSWPPKTEVFSLPCLGGLSLAAILKALDTGKADGVLALACHEGNCHSGTGSLLAKRRIKQAAELLKAVGADSSRVGAVTLAANSETALRQAVKTFWEQIKAKGPARPAK